MDFTKRNDTDAEHVLRLIDDLAADAPHDDDESRDVLVEAGIDPDRFTVAVRRAVLPAMPTSQRTQVSWEVVRSCAMAVAAAGVLLFVAVYHLNYRAGLDVQRQTARAQLISPLLAGLASDDPDRRSLALVVARQLDPTFAAETEFQLARWEMSSQAEARASRNAVHASRILTGVQKLELSRDPGDRKIAIWNDLLPVLLEARRNRDEFVDVAMTYQRVLPLLRIRDPEVFLDSYWGELWILNILLDSKIVPVVDAAREKAPEPAVVEAIYQRNAPRLSESDRKAFQEAVSAYVNTFQSLR